MGHGYGLGDGDVFGCIWRKVVQSESEEEEVEYEYDYTYDYTYD